jgi:hypothetical protein
MLCCDKQKTRKQEFRQENTCMNTSQALSSDLAFIFFFHSARLFLETIGGSLPVEEEELLPFDKEGLPLLEKERPLFLDEECPREPLLFAAGGDAVGWRALGEDAVGVSRINGFSADGEADGVRTSKAMPKLASINASDSLFDGGCAGGCVGPSAGGSGGDRAFISTSILAFASVKSASKYLAEDSASISRNT